MSVTATAQQLQEAVGRTPVHEQIGRVIWAYGGAIKATGLTVRIGQTCMLRDPNGGPPMRAEVIGFADGAAILSPLSSLRGLGADAHVTPGPQLATLSVGEALLGRVIDANGAPLDNRGPVAGPLTPQPIYADAPSPLQRRPIERLFETGVKVVDGLLCIGRGQRTGIFSPAGAGKSTLLGMIARHSRCDANVIALVGERGREVGEFLSNVLGPDGLSRSAVVVATSDRSALERIRAANVATAIAEGFRAQGRHVLLLMDSVTRYARALRELGLAMGEPSVRRGYPPSVFAELPRLFERAGASDRGSITAFYTVLLEEEADLDPIGEEVRSILDGHIYLSREISEANRYPAVDVSTSISRLFHRLATPEQAVQAARLRGWLAKLKEVEFLRQVGEYKAGGDAVADLAIARLPAIETFLGQPPHTAQPLSQTLAQLEELAGRC